MKSDILRAIGIEPEKCDINPNDAFFYSLIFREIGNRIDILSIVESFSDEDILKIANSLVDSNTAKSSMDNDTLIAHTRNYIGVLTKDMITKKSLEKHLVNK